ncbi:MAG: VTT domain-containing protein, partial [Bacteroidota bacterium]
APALAAAGEVTAWWPPNLPVDAEDIDVGIARTLTRAGELPGPPSGPSRINEIEALTLRAIEGARHHIYAENQYLTSRTITRAFGDRLASATGPEVVLVLPHRESGWMEQSSMGLLRDEALAYLRARDAHGRLRLLAPEVADGDRAVPVAVHSKVLVVDDTFVKMGSANFSNRSMGLDSECDLAVEATDAKSSAFVTSVRNRLLGEHLGLSAREIAARFAAGGSLLRIVDQPSAPDGRHRLVSVPALCDAPADLTLFDGAMVDPPEPWNTDMLLKRAFPRPLRHRLARRWLRPLGLAVVVVAAWALLRHFDPHGLQLRGWIRDGATWIAQQPGGGVGAAAAIALAGMLFIPFTLLATTALTVFGLWPGMLVVWAGAVCSAIGSHALGRRLGSRAVAWLPDRSLNGLRRFLGRRGFWAIVVIRMLPVGNFGVLNLLTGAVGVPRRAFILGNMVGLLPGLLGLGLFVDRAIEAVRHPTATNVAVAIAIVAVGTVIGIVLKRRIERATGAAAPHMGAKH